MSNQRYHERVVDAELRDRLEYVGGILIEGVRACGKTMTAHYHAASSVVLDSPLSRVRSALELDPSSLLEGETPRLIDEWQVAPELWNLVRHEIDSRGKFGQFVLTGSSVPAEDATRHSGAHRISKLRMRPMTLVERGLGSGVVSLRELFKGNFPSSDLNSELSIYEVLDALIHGGWPLSLSLSSPQAQRLLQDYIEDIISVDIPRLDKEPRRDPLRMKALIRSFSRHIGTEVSFNTISKDVESVSLSSETVVQYMNTLKRMFLVEEQPAWAPHLRSKYAVRTSPKLHFVDPALAAATMSVSSERLFSDLETAGQWFESMVVQHTRIFVESCGGRIYHYRDKGGREADIIIELGGQWAAIEVKLSQKQVSYGIQSLRNFIADIDFSRTPPPAFIAVITADGPRLSLKSDAELPDRIRNIPAFTFPISALGR